MLASNPWLVARVLAYLRIATVAARIAAAAHACTVWLVCVTTLVYTGYQPIRTATPTKLPTRYRLGEPIAAYATRDTARFDSDQS